MKKICLIFSFIFFSFVHHIFAQSMGHAFIKSYPPVVYEAGGQNWNAIQDSRGVMYIANVDGVLVFDQSFWKLIKLPNSEMVRNVTLSGDGRLYVLGDQTFGYLEKGENIKPTYYNLTSLLPEKLRNYMVTGIYGTDTGFYIVIAGELLKYENNKLTECDWAFKDAEGGFIRNVNKVGSELYFSYFTAKRTQKWFVVADDKVSELKKLDYTLKADNSRFFIIEGDKKNEIILVSQNGAKLYDKETKKSRTLFESFPEQLTQKGITSVVKLSNGLLGLGTRTSGLYVLNTKGNLIRNISRQSGLLDNEINNFYVDQQKGVWALLGNGISRVDLFSPFTSWYDEVGGWVTAILPYNEDLYVGSLGLYKKNATTFESVSGIAKNEQVWFIKEFVSKGKELVLVGTSYNTYLIEDGKAKVFTNVKGKVRGSYQSYYQSRINPNRIFLAGNRFIEVFEFKDEKFQFVSRMTNTEIDHIRTLQEDNDGVLWISCYQRGLFKTNLGNLSAKELRQQKSFKVEHLNQTHGLPFMSGNNIRYYHGDLIFSTQKGIYIYNKETNKFIPDPRFEKLFTERNASAQILWHNGEVNEDNELIVSAGKNKEQAIAIVFEGTEGSYWYDLPFKRLPIFEVEVLTKSEDGVIWIGGSGGLFRYNPIVEREFGADFNTLLNSVEVGEDSLLFTGYDFLTVDSTKVQEASFAHAKTAVPFDLNEITFKYSAPFYDVNQEGNKYQYMLEGFNDKWSTWTTQTYQRFTNLNPGKYTFRVRSQNVYGTISEEATYDFNIAYPWYFNIWSILIYVASISVGVLGVIRWNSKRLEEENKKLESVVAERTTEIAQRTAEIEKAYQNIHTLSVIGQKITSTLELTELNQIVYEHISGLMDVTSFGVGVVNEQIKKLEFRGFIEKQKVCEYEGIDLSKGDNFSINCYKNNEIVLINDLEEEYPKLFNGKTITIDATTAQSLIYVPLELKGKVVGILTVQILRKNAFTDKEKSLLESLASYVTIALSNIFSYNVIKEKNSMITDSIHYAENIQASFLPSKSEIGEVFHNYFLIHRPKDIVSGDFYWFSHKKEKLYVAVVDCTGHGVPGAFMSMVGTSLLNDVVNRSAQVTPADILLQLHKGIRKSFKQYETDNLDGMDIALCCIEPTSDLRLKVTYAGAKLPFYGIRNGEFFEIRGDNKSIGGHQKEKERFYTDHEFALDGGDTIYLISDGFAGQNDIHRKKFGNRRLKQMLLECMHLPMSEQGRFLEEELESYMEGVEQRDDITVFGMKL